MSFSMTITERVHVAGITVEQVTVLSANKKQDIDEDIADSETDKLLNFTCGVDELVGIIILSDQAITLETNNGTSPDDTIVLVADVPYIWYTGKYNSCKLTVDVTKVYVTNNSGESAHLRIESIEDPTP